MSGILDRMAKRALGALSTIQPLTPPQYAPIAGGIRPSLLESEYQLPAGSAITAGSNACPKLIRESSPRPRRRNQWRRAGARVSQPPIPKAVPANGASTPRRRRPLAGKIDRSNRGSVDLEAGPALGDQTEATPDPGASVIQAKRSFLREVR